MPPAAPTSSALISSGVPARAVPFYDAVVVGAGAAGLMCAIAAARRGRSVLLIEHGRAPGEKIRISGGGRCNFTNMNTTPANFISDNPRFCVSALSRFGPRDFVAMVDRAGIAWHEKAASGTESRGSETGGSEPGGTETGQLFCDGSARQIVDMLTGAFAEAGGELSLSTRVEAVERSPDAGEGTGKGAGEEARFWLQLSHGPVECRSLVVATGGLSIPKMGATGFGYDLAERFGLRVVPIFPALVPLTFDAPTLERLRPLAGIAVDARVATLPAPPSGKKTPRPTAFAAPVLFTHRGLSGPAILQISSYWREGEALAVPLAPGVDQFAARRAHRAARPRQAPRTALAQWLPKRLAEAIAEGLGVTGNLADLPDRTLRALDAAVNGWHVRPAGTEGWRTAEVTRGGVDTACLDGRTMEARGVPGLHFVGEVVDVTGWLGGYNFQWAWASGWAAGQAV
ncbi:MAG: NAD(P)/FAD-dependent oxidoreductase [Alphaproteobacteria bacterium]